MSGRLTLSKRYLEKANQSVALAKVATSNKSRARHFANAAFYLRCAEAEAQRSNDRPRARVKPVTTHEPAGAGPIEVGSTDAGVRPALSHRGGPDQGRRSELPR